MKTATTNSLRAADLKKLLSIPEGDVLGEVIRLNCTYYGNGLDVLRVCTLVKERRQND